jgi:hypothetical protein
MTRWQALLTRFWGELQLLTAANFLRMWRVRGLAEQPQRAASSASPPAQDVRPRTEVENLGTQRLEGLLAIGTRSTKTIPAGMEGNDRVLTVAREIWRSQDMRVRLLEKRSDPRTGDTETRLTNLEKSEPDAALFQVPADDTIKDQ